LKGDESLLSDDLGFVLRLFPGLYFPGSVSVRFGRPSYSVDYVRPDGVAPARFAPALSLFFYHAAE